MQSKSKLLNIVNQDLPKKEARLAELDRLIKEREARLRDLGEELESKEGGNGKESEEAKEEREKLEKMVAEAHAKIKLMESSTGEKITLLESQAKEREEAIDSYKKKIIALELAAEDEKKRADAFALQVKQLEDELKKQNANQEKNFKKVAEIATAGTQTDGKVKFQGDIDSDEEQRKKDEAKRNQERD